VLVIPDQFPLGVCGQGGLAGARETEEEGHISSLALVGAGVQGQDPGLGHEVVHDGEDSLLRLPGEFRSKDHNLVPLEVHVNGGPGGHALGEAVGRKLSSIDDIQVRSSKTLELGSSRPDHHVLHEQGVVGAAADDSDLDPVGRVPACVAVDDEDVGASVEVVNGALTVDHEAVLAQFSVDRAPPDVIPRCLLVGNALVCRAAARLLPRISRQSTRGGNGGALLVLQSKFVHYGN